MIKNAQIRNILWMFVDKAFLLVGSFVVSVMVARYLGPEQLGLISYGVALGALVIAVSQWGANYTIFNTAAKNFRRSVGYIVNTEKLRLYIYLACFTVVNVWLFIFGDYTSSEYQVVSLVVLSQIFLGLDIYQYHYNALLKSKINAKSSIIAKTVSMSLRAIFVYFQFGIVVFIIPFFIEGYILYKLRKQKFKQEFVCNSDLKYTKQYFHLGLPLVATGVCIAIYTKMYEVMLANLVSYKAVGIYSVAFVINAAWTFVPMSIGISLVSKPMKEKNQDQMMLGYSFVTLIVFLSSLPMLILTFFIPEEIIYYTFGDQYLDSARILFILALGSMLSTLVFITNRMINSMPGGGEYILKKVLISSILMVVVCYFLVENYGVYGAALGFLLSELINLTLFNYFFKRFNLFKLHLQVPFSFSYYKQYIDL
jgi:O-antigen/teichoic acid export membrane protein